MTFSYSTSTQTTGDTTGTSITSPSITVPAGALVVVLAKHEGTSGETITISSTADGATDGHGTQINHSTGDLSVRFGYFLAHSSTTNTFVATFSSTVQYRRIMVMVYTHDGSAALDQEGGAQGNSASMSSGNITTTGSSEVVFGGSGEYSALNISSMQINGSAADQSLNPVFYCAMWSKIFSSTFTGAATATISSGGAEWTCPIISFKETGGGGGGTGMQINIGDAWKEVAGVQINIGDSWKSVSGAQINIGDAWKTIF